MDIRRTAVRLQGNRTKQKNPLTFLAHHFILSAVETADYDNSSLFLFFQVQEKMELPSLPLANERRPCVLVGRDNMALPASLISQIGYRCHPSLYTEGDPGEKVELVAGRTACDVVQSTWQIKKELLVAALLLFFKLLKCGHGNRNV